MHRTTRIPAARTLAPVLVIALLVSGLTAIARPARAQEGPTPPDGLSAPTAAASCWEIKQHDPSAESGTYWLVTPTLVAPEQFHCDMTTDGGGWVLVGRGREGWRTDHPGQGSPADVRTVVDGVGAFNTRQLSGTVIDGLLDGGRVDALVDGIRLRRAADRDGTAYQEARFHFLDRDRWVWTFGAEHRVGSWTIGTTDGSGGLTSSFGADNSFRRIDTSIRRDQDYTWGFSYGSSVAGYDSSTSYLWSSTDGRSRPRPFTQVWLRPRLLLEDLTFPQLPDEGTPAQQLPALLGDGVLPQTWGVAGLANGISGELHTEVAAFAQIGERVYVGGNFRYVQQTEDASGADRHEQSWLAAFDVTTGAWIPEFAPDLDGQVKALAALPDGTLAVGGEFTDVNGQARPAFARLDATTGATAAGWGLQVENLLTGGVPIVREFVVQDGWLYLGGAFTHVSNFDTGRAYTKMMARVSADDGVVDRDFNPVLNSSIIDMSGSESGTRVYASGYFTQTDGTPTPNAVSIDVDTAQPSSPLWSPTWSANSSYQQAIEEAPGRVWVGGSEHSLFSFSTSTFDRLSGSITKQGGDFQSIIHVDGVIYGTCHCSNFNYENAFTWSNVGTGWTQADDIDYIGAWDAATGDYIPEFNPTTTPRDAG